VAGKLCLFVLTTFLFSDSAGALVPENVIDSTKQWTLAIYHEENGYRYLHGGGFFVDEEENIITNYHVIRNRENLIGVLPDKTEFRLEAVPMGIEEKNDLAVLRIVPNGSKPKRVHGFLRLNEVSSLPQAGLPVVAIGHGGGKLWSFMRGSVTGGPCFRTKLGEFKSWVSDIRFSPAIIGGYSGGPLVDERGYVLGVNTESDDKEGRFNNPAECSFAISAVKIRAFLYEHQEAVRDGLLDNSKNTEFVDAIMRDYVFKKHGRWKRPEDKGVVIIKIKPYGTADAWGLKAGDIILKVGPRVINNIAEFEDAILREAAINRAGRLTLSVELIRDGVYNILYLSMCPGEKSFVCKFER